jgi:hypothetical protein
MHRPGYFLVFLLADLLLADVTACACDPAFPETLQARECSLCQEAEKATEPIFFLKDINPRKPNRWLVLPKAHWAVGHPLDEMPHAERTRLWEAAIEKAKSLWGDEWGLAYNSEQVRTQCHAHIHIGKLLKGVESGKFVVVRSPSQIPVPKGKAIWVHPHGNKLHVHVEDNITETVLLR